MIMTSEALAIGSLLVLSYHPLTLMSILFMLTRIQLLLDKIAAMMFLVTVDLIFAITQLDVI